MGLLEAEQWAREYSKTLQASDQRFHRWVYVLHVEGTTFMFRSAFYLICPDRFHLAVFPEHHQVHVFARDELRGVWQLEELAEQWRT